MRMRNVGLLAICALTFAFLFFNFSDAYAITLHVPEEYATIQSAINAAVNGDEVLVNDGTYQEAINFLGKAITVTSVNGPQVTIIDGNGTIPVLVTFELDETQNAILDGFTVQKAYYFGIKCDNFSAPTIRNNIITWNRYNGLDCAGVGSYGHSSPTITHNIIANNYTASILCEQNSSPLITNNTIFGNGSIVCEGASNPAISDNTLIGNGISCHSSATITNNIITGSDTAINVGDASDITIIRNIITGNGNYGIYCYNTPSITITDNIITSNGYYGIWISSPSAVISISHNDVWNNGGDTNGDGIAEWNYHGNAQPGTGDISQNPLFEGVAVSIPQDYPTIQEGIIACSAFRLATGSPCIGAASDGNNIGRYSQQTEYGTAGDFIINVSPGTYVENLSLSAFVKLIGAGASSTIIDGNNNGKSAVKIIVGRAEGVIRGFTIRNGNYGISSFSSFFRIADNIITQNTDNGIKADSGAGSHDTCYLTIANNSISANGMSGIQCFWASSARIFNNIIFGNSLDGIDCHNWSRPANKIMNNVILGNGRHGVSCYYRSEPTVINNIITGNSEYGVYDYDSDSTYDPEITYNDIWNNAEGSYGGYAGPGNNDISLDPLFVNAGAGNYRLSQNSPAINAGDPDPIYNDLDGSRNDMGAYGGPYATPVSINITSPQEGEIMPTLTPTIIWNTSGIGANANLRLVIRHPNLLRNYSKRSGIKNTLLAIAGLFDTEPAYAQEVMPLSITDLDVIIPNTGTYTIPAGILSSSFRYTLELASQEEPGVKDIVHFRVSASGRFNPLDYKTISDVNSVATKSVSNKAVDTTEIKLDTKKK
ncbi:MAG: right-handed parallel beta-helix repeat-containing protein [Candidatus Omnitrophica bacterium]|nr:right-handed parallel beta-helix repeat-containing protein [Candidatus Omnitrophota bacterium]MDD5351630.1 right-handed parallel beta-helix repeat-containing protein [Candidatus Omnitrophota bacterium]MDD5550840.1 right-handed parallel beta-helix repeat-containing protein [Candidatus Omnitrophota bacterium]